MRGWKRLGVCRWGSAGMASLVLAAVAPVEVAEAVELNAIVKGACVDPDGLPIPRALVTLTSPDLLGDRQAETDDDGRFRFTGLPPGVYTVSVMHGFFDDWASGEMRANQGQSIRLSIKMATKDSGEEFTVYGEAPAVDVENVSMGVVLDHRYLKDVPSGRDYQSAMEITPGIVGGGNANVHGGFYSSNQFYVDGVNITDPLTNTFSMNMNYDAIESIEVITGGMDAEYGRALGGAINVVTKSGGNEFEGNATLTYSHPNMVVAPVLDGDSEGTDLQESLTLNLGGPILKDKLWFFASVQADRYISTVSVDPDEVNRDMDRFPIAPRDWRSLYLFGKLTYQPTPAHRLWIHAQADPTWIDNVEQSVWVLPSAETIQNQGGWLGSIGHQFAPNDRFLWETQLYYQYSVIKYFSVLWKDCDNWSDGVCTDDFVGTDYLGEPVTESWWAYDEGFYSGELYYADINYRYRGSLNSSASLWFDALGEHHAKFGIQADYMSSYNAYPGQEEEGCVYADPVDVDGDGIVDPNDLDSYEPVLLESYDTSWEARVTGMIFSWYMQDVWKPIPRLTVRPGLRFDWTNLLNDANESVFSRLTVAPRIGVAFDLTGDGKTAVHAYYGRFYDSGFLIISDLLRKGETGIEYYDWDSDAQTWGDEPSYTIGDQFLAADDLRNPYSDEFNIGFAREIAADVAFDASFVYEEARRFWEDDEVNLIWDEDGSDVIGLRSGEDVSQYRLRTPDDTFTRYTSVELSLTKSFSNNWTVLGSYTWSRAYGTNSYDQASGLYDIMPQRQYEIGLLDHDITHAAKIAGSYTNPLLVSAGKFRMGYVVGWNFLLRSGYPYRRLYWNNYYGGYWNYGEVGDDRYRLPAYSQFDVRLGINLEIGPTRWMLGADCFNLFNSRTITDVDTRFDPEAVGDAQPFGDVLDRQSRRRFQFVARGEF